MRFLSPSRRVTSQRAVLQAASQQPPSRTTSSPISREDTIAELRAIYILLNHQDIATAKQRLVTLGQNLQS